MQDFSSQSNNKTAHPMNTEIFVHSPFKPHNNVQHTCTKTSAGNNYSLKACLTQPDGHEAKTILLRPCHS